jgi:alcohol dehydrogenase, propanol-preferring
MTGVDGGYAEYFLAEAAFAVKVPAGVNVFERIPLTCASVTTFKAIKVGDVRPGELVALSGIGGLGIWRCSTRRSSAAPWPPST